MSAAVEKLAHDIVVREGKFVNNPADHGGATQYGVSINFAREVPDEMDLNHDHLITTADIRLVTPEIAAKLYVEHFFNPWVSKLPEPIQPFMFDTNVNGGAGSVLQRCLNTLGFHVASDGSVGPATIAAAKACCAKVGGNFFINALVQARKDRFRSLVARNPSQGVFLKGWLARADSFKVKAKAA